MKIQFVDLQRQIRNLRKEIDIAINGVLERADFIQGKSIEEFENNFAKLCNKKYCVALNSGTDALEFALRVYGVKDGEVITAPNSYFSSAMVITKVGAKPVFVDVDEKSMNINVNKIEDAITKETRAIIPVHLCGQPADLDPIYEIAEKHNLVVVEDACQAHLAEYKGKRVPVGETGAFSFYPGKNLGSFGDGGALVTDNEEIADKVKVMRNDGSRKKYYHEMIGAKSRMDTIQAAVLNVKLKYLEEWTRLRREHAKKYNSLLKGIVRTPEEMPYAKHVYHLYQIKVDNRDDLQKYLADKGISTVIHYPIPIHLQEAYKGLGHKEGDFPITEKLAKSILSLPMFPELKDEEIKSVCETVKEFVNKH